MSASVNAHVDPTTVMAWTSDPGTVTMLDVRGPAEFETRHIAGAYNLPLNFVGELAPQLAARLDHKVVLVCESGVRASQARQRLAGAGMDDLYVLDGGVPGYAAAGGQMVHGRSRWALERQVRLVAGSLVLVGILVSRWAPQAALLAGGVGAGLTVSALTDTCTMGRLLSALPYNRGPESLADQLLDQLPTPRTAQTS